MKAIAKFLTLVTVLVLLAGGYVVWAAELKITLAGTHVESAADRSQAFEGIRQSSEVGSPDLVMYENSITGTADQYVFVTYTIKMRNLNALPAEWLQIDIAPHQGDVLMVKAIVEDVPAFSEQLVTVVLMTSRSVGDYTRTATLSYYVYGHEITVPIELHS